MVYAPQRRHAVVSISSVMQALALVQHLYSPNTIVLIFRVTNQIYIRAPAEIHPNRSLLALFFLVLGTNLAAVLFHLDHDPYDDRGLILDFVGQANKASLTRVLLLDLAIFLLQVITLVVSYVSNYTKLIPESDLFPYDDLLLPPAASQPVMTESDLDIEYGDQFRQRRQGKGPRYQGVSTDETELRLEDEDEDEVAPVSSSSRPRVFHSISSTVRGRRAGVPLIFNLSLSHLAKLIFRLPAPVMERVFSGGTPINTPPATPTTAQAQAQAARESLAALVTGLSEAQQRSEAAVMATSVQRLAAEEEAGSAAPTGGSRGDTDGGHRERGERGERIPGDYWTSRA